MPISLLGQCGMDPWTYCCMNSITHNLWFQPFLSILAVYLTTSIHHLYGAWLYDTPWRAHIATQGISFLLVSVAFLMLYHFTKKKVFYWLLLAVAGFFFVLAIGVFEGGYNHVLKNILFFGGMNHDLLHTLYPPPKYELPNDLLFEVSGGFTFFISMYCARTLLSLGNLRFRFKST